MKSRGYCLYALIVSTTFLLAGCMPKMTIEDLKAMKPQRPAELKELNAFTGHWTWKGTATMAGLDQPLTFDGTSDVTWEGDGWYLVSRETGNMQEMGETKGMGTWTYDTHAGKYRTTWVDSMGMVGMGTVKHESGSDVWHVKAKSYGPFGTSTAKGTITFTGPDSMQWSWKEYAFWGLMKVMELDGTGTRSSGTGTH